MHHITSLLRNAAQEQVCGSVVSAPSRRLAIASRLPLPRQAIAYAILRRSIQDEAATCEGGGSFTAMPFAFSWAVGSSGIGLGGKHADTSVAFPSVPVQRKERYVLAPSRRLPPAGPDQRIRKRSSATASP
jgi:hypothetical protein